MRRYQKTDYKKVEETYDPSKSDEDNARFMGISYSVFQRWRTSKGYVNNINRSMKKRIDLEKFKTLYDLGYSDVEIADELDVRNHTVTVNRLKLKLPPNTGYSKFQRFVYAEKTHAPEDEDKPWKDPESMYCDKDFLEKFVKGEFGDTGQAVVDGLEKEKKGGFEYETV